MLRKTHILVLFFLLATSIFQVFADTASDEILAAYTKMRDLKSYRMRMNFTVTGEAAQQMEKAKSMGIDFQLKPILQEVVNPDTRKLTMEMPMMSTGSTPHMPSMDEMRHMTQQQMQEMQQQMQQGGPHMPQMLYVKMYAVRNGNHVATYEDCVECEKKIDEQMKQQLKNIEETMAKSMLGNILSGPSGWISAGVEQASLAAQAAVMPKIVEKTKEEMSLNRWKCREGSGEEQANPNEVSFPNAKALGTEKVGTEDAKTYQFDGMDKKSQQTMPVKLYVSAASGMPLKMEMKPQQGTVTMEFYDFNAPINIELPDCMKK